MEVVGFNGSPRKNGSTAVLIQTVFRELENEGTETELVQLSHKSIHGCVACYQCMEEKNERCAGPVRTLDTMSHFFLSTDIIIVGLAIGIGRDK